jgi:hypothetical protein
MLPEQNVLGKKSGISGWWCVNEVTHPTRSAIALITEVVRYGELLILVF